MPLTKCENIATNKYEIEFTADAMAFAAAVQKAYNQEKKNISIPGFRKGKAPRNLIEKLYGEAVFYEKAVNNLLNELLPVVVDEANLTLVDKPTVEVTSMDKEAGVTYKAVCITYPEIELGEYKGITVEKAVYTVTDKDIDEQLEALRRKGARAVSVDRPAELGDTVVMDFLGSVDGVPFDGGAGEDFDLKLGSGQFIPGFEDALVGHNAGEEFDINVKFPEDYHMDELKGKDAVFHIKLSDVTREELPEISDELVEDYSEYKTVDEYREAMKKQLEETNKNKENSETENRIFQKILDITTAEIPEIMIENKIDKQIQEFESRILSQGINLETYLKYTATSMEDFRANYLPRATDEVKLRLALEKIAKLENVTVTDEEMQTGIEGLAAQYNMPVNKVKRLIPYQAYMEDLLVGKAADIVKAAAVITEPSGEDKAAE